MPIRGKLISEVRPSDIFELITQQAPEDALLEFKKTVLHRNLPPAKLEEERGELTKDIASFANAAGGHIIIGVEEDGNARASNPAFMTGDEAKSIAQALRDLAIKHLQPPIRQIEVLPLAMDLASTEWVVIAAIPDSPDKPHMSTKDEGTHFVIRTGNRKRPLTHAEIQAAFLNGPQQQLMSKFLLEIESIRTLVEEVRGKMKEGGVA